MVWACLLGRLLAPEDVNLAGTGTSLVAVLSYDFWQRRFGGASDAVGKEIAIEGQPFTIIGVSRKWFTGMTTGQAPDLTIPMKGTDNRALLWVFITGRLRDGVSVAQARAQLQSFWPEVLRATASTETPGLRRQAFLREALALALLGTGLGIPCALAASRLLARMLFGLSSHDLPTLAAVSLLLLAVALFAGYWPARRASRIDPMAAVRME